MALRVEHGRVDPNGERLVEDVSVGLADIDHRGSRDWSGQQPHGLLGVERHAQHARDVHDGPERDDAQRDVAAEQLGRHLADRPVATRDHDQAFAGGGQAADLGPRPLLGFGGDDVRLATLGGEQRCYRLCRLTAQRAAPLASGVGIEDHRYRLRHSSRALTRSYTATSSARYAVPSVYEAATSVGQWWPR